MTASVGVSREMLKWLLGLDLSFPVRNVKRDLANGYLVAEILSRYFPKEVDMHSFENVCSLTLKECNWHVLLKLFKVTSYSHRARFQPGSFSIP